MQDVITREEATAQIIAAKKPRGLTFEEIVSKREQRKTMQIKSFSIREDLWQELQRQAEQEERSASAILRDLIRRYLQQQKKRRRS